MKKTIIMSIIMCVHLSSVLAEDNKVLHQEDIARVLSICNENPIWAYQTAYDFTYEVIEDKGSKSRGRMNAILDMFGFALFDTYEERGCVETATIKYVEKESTLDVSYDYTDGKKVTMNNDASITMGEKEIDSVEKLEYVKTSEELSGIAAFVYLIRICLF